MEYHPDQFQGLDWVEQKKRQKLEHEKEEVKTLSVNEKSLRRIEFLKQDGIGLAERDCPWQAIGRWDEALEIPVEGKSDKDLGHERLLDMKAQCLIQLHEWEPAIESAQASVKIDPLWWPGLQTLGRAYLGYGKLQEAVTCFSKALHLNPESDELRNEDLAFASDLLEREKSGDRTWKPLKEPSEHSDDEDDDFEITDEMKRELFPPKMQFPKNN